MSTLKPVFIEISGFRSFSEKEIVHFPQSKRGAILINGKYKDGTTSSGSGKSSILMAMAFALGFCDVPSTELKSWYGKKINIRLRLTDGTNIYDIVRDPKLKLMVNEAPYEGTSAGAKEKLDEIMRSSPELVKALTYRPQRERGVFLTNTDAKNKEFLTKILKLDEIEAAVDLFAAEMSSKVSGIAMIEQSIDQMSSLIVTSKVHDDDVRAAKESLDSTKARLDELQSQSDGSELIKKELIHIDLELNKIQSASMEVYSAKQQNMSIRQRVELIQAEISKLKSGNCPTCEREWDKFHGLVDQKGGEINQLVESMKSNLTVISAASAIVNEDYRVSLSDRKNQLHGELGRNAAPLNDAIQAHSLAKTNCANISRSLDSLKSLEIQLSTKKEDLSKAQIEVHVLEHSSKLLGRQGFLGGIFDEVLREIKGRANDLMSYMPNINTFSIDISSNSVTQSGKVNKKIKVSLFKDGVEKSVKTLSGGQMVALELCTDLAVSETIRARSGSNLGWVALDEAMDGLDVETKVAALDIIKSKVDGLLIVVDHSTEIKEAFDSVINVEYDGKRSYVS